jgi:epoxyqueuosine reductase
LPDFDERQGLVGQQLIKLFAWSEEDFLRYTEGSAIRRIGHERWLRNLAVAMGNALRSDVVSVSEKTAMRTALEDTKSSASALVLEHVQWAMSAH